jgi:DNA-3-methyladenine glycosylase
VADRRADRPRATLARELLAGDSLAAARALIGARLVRDPALDAHAGDPLAARRVGRIVEVEAYIGVEDLASHARMGPTARNRVMFGPPGIAYVYLVYGMHHCLNVVTEPDGRAAALLIRAVEPLEGIEAMRAARRAVARHRPPREVAAARLAAGPGLVGAAFSIDRSLTGLDLCAAGSPLRLEPAPGEKPANEVVATPRIGIAYAGEPWISRPWRLLDPSSSSVSGPRP